MYSFDDFFVEVYKAFDDFNYEEISKWNKSHDENLRLKLPQFLAPIPGYDEADIKVMIFGQEPLCWSDPDQEWIFYEDAEAEDFITLYKGYMNLLNNESSFRNRRFNKEYHRLQKLITSKCNAYGKKAGFMWNDLIKLTPQESGNSGLKYFNQINAIRESSELIKYEISFFKPNIVFFLSGPKYDFVIQNHIKVRNNTEEVNVFNVKGKKEVSGFPINQLCLFDIEGIDFALRTYHPQARLTSEDWEKLHSRIDELILSYLQDRFE